jgi:alpha-galactosidase
MVRISLIGAGSVVFSTQLVTDLFTFSELVDGLEISLMDIDRQRLEKIDRVLENVVEENGLNATIETTTDRRDSLEDADYVVTTIHVGGREPFENEIRIPAEYGVKQSVGDTLGPGGVFRALRTIPTMLDIARDMEELCPEALLLNYTNPMAILCWAIDEATDIEVVGLCHSVQGTSQRLAKVAGIPYDEVNYKVAGINHMAWFLEIEHRPTGRSLYPELSEAIEDPEVYRGDNVRFQLMKHFGHFVTESSHHLSEYLPYFRTEEEIINKLSPASSNDQYPVRWMPTGEYFRHWCEYQEEAAEKSLGEYDTSLERSDEYGSRIVHSIETGQPRRMNINMRNDTDMIQNLPSNACVEVPCLVDGTGVNPTSVGELPPQLAALNQTNINVQSMAVRGALTKNLNSVRQAVKLDPLTAASLTLGEVDELIDDLIKANAEYLLDEFVEQLDDDRAGTPADD